MNPSRASWTDQNYLAQQQARLRHQRGDVGVDHRAPVIEFRALRRDGTLDYLRPDGKSQVTIEYDGHSTAMPNAPTVSELASVGVKRVSVGTNHNMPNALIHHRPQNELQAKFSMEFCMAILLIERKAGLEQFTDDVVNRPDVQALLQRVDFGVNAEAEAAGDDAGRLHREGGPARVFPSGREEWYRQAKETKRGEMGGRESQHLIVPWKRGNQPEGPRRGKGVPSHEPLKGNLAGTS